MWGRAHRSGAMARTETQERVDPSAGYGPRRAGALVLLALAMLLLTFTVPSVPAPGAPAAVALSETSPMGTTDHGQALWAPADPSSPLGSCPIPGLMAPLSHRTLGPSAPVAGTGGLSAHSVDPLAVPNSGFEFNLSGYSMPIVGSGSFLLTEQEVIADQILTMGLFANYSLTPSGPIPFWLVVDNSTGHFISCGYNTGPVTQNESVSFQAVNTGNRTWEILYQGSLFPYPGSNNITLNGSVATWTGGIGVVSLGTWTGSPWVPAMVDLPLTMRVRTSANPTAPWYLPRPVVVSWNGTVPPAWGEAGAAQRGYLAPGALELGTSVPVVTNGTALWTTSAPTPLSVTLNATPRSVSGGATVTLALRAVAAGVPISGLTVDLVSTAGGTFSPALPWTTDAQGKAQGNYSAPLVSAAQTAWINASVGNGLFQGSASSSVQISPTTLALTVSLSASTVAPGGTVNVTLKVLQGSQGVPRVNVTFSASVGGGAFVPASPWVSDAQGEVLATYTVPPTSGEVVLSFSVSQPGYSGSAQALLNVTGSSGSGGSGSYLAVEEAGAVVVVLAVLIALLYLRGRAARRKFEDEEAATTPEEGTPGPAGHGPKKAGPSTKTSIAATEEKGRKEPEERSPEPSSASDGESSSKPLACPACGVSLVGVHRRFCPKCGAPLDEQGT